jgi:hypothetical protein
MDYYYVMPSRLEDMKMERIFICNCLVKAGLAILRQAERTR